MKKSKNVGKIENVAIHYTKDYSAFKRLKGNRPVEEPHVREIMGFMTENYIPSLVRVIVNEQMETIDGQHTVEALSRLKKPVPYRIVPGLRLKDAINMNTGVRIWNKKNFMNSHCELGNKCYLRLKEFMGYYPDFSQSMCESLLTNSHVGANRNKQLRDATGKLVRRARVFQDGGLTFTDEDWIQAHINAGRIMEFKKLGFLRYNSTVFVNTMITVFKNPKYDHDLMLKKLSFQPTKLRPCTNTKDYLRVIEDIYNWKNPNHRIRLT
jgi:hypothetical protein